MIPRTYRRIEKALKKTPGIVINHPPTGGIDGKYEFLIAPAEGNMDIGQLEENIVKYLPGTESGVSKRESKGRTSVGHHPHDRVGVTINYSSKTNALTRPFIHEKNVKSIDVKVYIFRSIKDMTNYKKIGKN